MTVHQDGIASAGEPVSGDGNGEAASPLRRIAAWGVHLSTASGAVFCLLAIDAGIERDWREAFAWLMLAGFVDALDGCLARWVRVKEVLPRFDGALLDNLVDYASYVLVPAFLLHRAELLPAQYSFWVASAIVLASAYQFCQSGAKTPDHYFTGFPSYWNVTVLYLLALQLSPVTNLAIIILLIILVFVPVKYVYPSRTPHCRTLTLALATLWVVSLIAIVWQLPDPPRWLLGLSLFYVAYYLSISLYLTFKQPGRYS
jgi:phosphatidylcholine synthase